MKHRHIAVLALVGWYLMELPPNVHHFIDYKCVAADDPQLSQHLDYPKLDGAPLWQWYTLAVFDDQEHCEEALRVEFQIQRSEQKH